MKIRTKILFCLLFYGISTVSISQDITIDISSELHYVNLTVQGDIKRTFDIVFPEVVIRYRINLRQTEQGSGFLEALYNNKTYKLTRDMNQLLFDINSKREHLLEISDENLAKAFVYLSLLQGPEPIINNNIDTIIVKKESYNYQKPGYKPLREDLLKFNYHVCLIFSESNYLFFWKQADFFLRIHDHTLFSGYRSLLSKRDKVSESPVWEMKLPKNLLQKGKNCDLNQLFDRDGIDDLLQFSIETYLPGPVGVLTLAYSDGKKCIYMQTGKNGIPEPGCSTKFKISGINQSMSNLYLKIYTSPVIGSSIPLFSSRIININSNGEGETELKFAPANNLNDGFCKFELWNGNSLLSDNTGSQLVLEKLKTGTFTNSTMPYSIHFAYSFFNPKPSVEADQYVGKVENALKEAWNQQVGDWNFCAPYSQPSNTNPDYGVAISPNQLSGDVKYYWYDTDGTGCFASWESYRHIGFSADIREKYPTYGYSEDDFIEIVMGHEFFHGIQCTFEPDKQPITMNWLIEGQARFLQTVMNDPSPEYDLAALNLQSMYHVETSNYILHETKNSLWDMSYRYCLFWRYLFENCNPTATVPQKLEIIRSTLTEYPTPDIPSVETFLDSKLNSTPYLTMDGVIKDFSKRVYFDQVPGTWTPCPPLFYPKPNTKLLYFNGSPEVAYGSTLNSFGFEYTTVKFNSTGEVYITFNGDPYNSGNTPEYYVNVVFENDYGKNNVISFTAPGHGERKFDIAIPGTKVVVIVARLDNNEGSLCMPYTITVQPAIPPDVLKADFVYQPSGPQTINTSINFFDKSSHGSSHITSWHWSFPGSQTPESTEQNPTGIYYDHPGEFTVSLTVRNDNDEDTQTKVNFVLIYDLGGGGNTVEFSGYGPLNGNPGEPLTFNISIDAGTPPFQISYNFSDGYHFTESNVYSLFSNLQHSFSNPGEYSITYIVRDHLNNYSTETDKIFIGVPGMYLPSARFTFSTIGRNFPIDFYDQTIGGVKPYTSWQWIFGDEVLTGAHPTPRWSIIGNTFPPDPNMSGDIDDVIFPEYGTYPVTLVVNDFYGFPCQTTEYIEVKTAVKCLKLYEEFMNPVHINQEGIYKMRFSSSMPGFYFNDYGEYFQAGTQECIANYGTGLELCNACAISEARWTIKKKNSSFQYQTIRNLPNGYSYPWYYWWMGSGVPYYPSSFCPPIPSKGNYQVTLEAWNRLSCPSGGTPATTGDHSMYDALVTNWVLVDCDEVIDIEQDIPAGPHDTEYSGSFTFAQTNAVNVNVGADIAYEANNELTIFPNPGFIAIKGSSFKASVDFIPPNKHLVCEAGGVGFNDLHHFFDDDYLVSPNPNSGTFHISGRSESNIISTVKIFDQLGKICHSYISYLGNEAYVSIENAKPGIYIIIIINDKIQVFNKKLIIVK